MARTYLMLLWHMHQPYYKDLVEDRYTMPWVRMHTLKDYFGMVAMLKDFPSVHATFNLVPSLVAQIEDYAKDRAKEEPYELAFRPAAQLSSKEREALVDSAFQINRENLLSRYPRFVELYEKAVGDGIEPGASRLTSVQEILDLQVLSQLAWFDEIYLATDPEIVSLVGRQRGYTEADKQVLQRKEIELCGRTLEEYRAAAERRQVELSTSPFYHPILPLLCDSDAGAESHPGLRLPRRRFHHPEDARAQMRAAIDLHERVFGTKPQGLWPSEGSVSEAVLRIAAEEGFAWAATDEGVLGRSLEMGFSRNPDGTVQGGYELYRPHRFATGGQYINLFFRDHELSDLIGFVYSRMDPNLAAHDLFHRIRVAARSRGEETAVVSVILDGENAWEYYAGNGREFLKSFYGLLSSQDEVRAVTASEALQLASPGILPKVAPGSWINANFDVWIGAEEDNQAWDRLGEARDYFSAHAGSPGIPPTQVELARQELWVAEGSDWCWWYGPEHSTENDEEFDLLYRKHLSNIYRLLNGTTPDVLAAPIKGLRTVAGLNVAPTGLVAPHVDGNVTTYFEWLGAGVYFPDGRSGSLHGAAQHVDAVHYGYSENAVFLRVDLKEAFLSEHPEFEIRINFDGDHPARLHARVMDGALSAVAFWRREEPMKIPEETGRQVRVAYGNILEMGIDYTLLQLKPGEKTRVQVSLWLNELPVQVVPPEGWLALELTEDLVSW
ncbi:MAG TPA: glycoside hydrolase family 57 protein [Terriglobia bacterium]|nr:glycoside hydrolase family 57 protein [Terriglobia bacterium]